MQEPHMQPNVLFAYINFYARKGYFNHVVQLCSSRLNMSGEDPIFRFWLSFGHAMDGNIMEAIKGYNTIKEKREVQVAVLAGLIDAHQKSENKDENELQALTTEFDVEIDTAPESAKIQLALFYIHVDDSYEARKYIDMLDENYKDRYLSACTVKGWIKLRSGTDLQMMESEKYFDMAIKQQTAKPDLDALMGKSKYLEMKKLLDDAIKPLNIAIANFPDFSIALTEQARLLVSLGKWEDATLTCKRVMDSPKASSNDGSCNQIDAIFIAVLFLVVKRYSVHEAVSHLEDLFRVVQQKEPRNIKLILNAVRTFSRLCGSHKIILDMCIDLLEKAEKRNPPANVMCEILAEEGYLYIMKNDLAKAEKVLNQAVDFEEGNIVANRLLLKSYILNQKIDDAKVMLDFLKEVESTEEISQTGDGESLEDMTSRLSLAELNYLSALMAWYSERDQEGCIRLLDETMDIYCKAIETMSDSTGIFFYQTFSAQFMLEIARLYYLFCPSEPLEPTDPPLTIIEKTTRPIQLLVSHVPGCIESQIMFATTKYISRDFETAQQIIKQCLKLDPAYSEAHILQSQIAYAQENYQESLNALSRALANDLSVKDWPQYNLMKARASSATGDQQVALQCLEFALSMVSDKSRSGQEDDKKKMKKSKKKDFSPGMKVTLHDQVSIYLELAKVHMKLNQNLEATKIIEDALNKFKNTEEEGRIIISNAKLAAKRNDFDQCMSILNNVPIESRYYIKARSEVAYMHLVLRNDKRSFARCYEELVKNLPQNANSYIFLGEAYMNIQEPEKAIQAFQNALKLDPYHSSLRSRIGQALVSTHQYNEAIQYYKDAIEQQQSQKLDAQKRHSLVYDLSQLYLKLKKYNDASTLIQEYIQQLNSSNIGEIGIGEGSLKFQVQFYRLLSDVQKWIDRKQSMESLMQARKIQNQVLHHLKGSTQQESIYIQKNIAANICFELGTYHQDTGSIDNAITYYNEALSQDNTHESSMLALADLNLRKNDLDGCMNQCQSVLRVNPSHERASMILADVLFRKNRYTEAIELFEKLLQINPSNFRALVQLIQHLRRAGKLEEGKSFLERVEKENMSVHTRLEPGYHFAQGLYCYYTFNPNQALHHFNFARKSGEWGGMAIEYMIQIYLDPDHSTMPSGKKSSSTDNSGVEDIDAGIKSAQDLFRELSAMKTIPETKLLLLEGQILISKPKVTKNDLEKALQLFGQICAKETGKENVSAHIMTSIVFEKLKQSPKARNILKRVLKLEYTQENADYFEKGWLLFADSYIQAGKYDLAQQQLKLLLTANKSCSQAWEMLGLIYEKDSAYKDAADCYQNAWKLTHEKDPSIGFKLAFNYLKAKRFVNAIDICNKVLKQNKNYPKIKKDILEKARFQLRP